MAQSTSVPLDACVCDSCESSCSFVSARCCTVQCNAMYIYIYIYYLYLSIHLLHICQQISVYVEGDLCFEMRANTKPITSNLASPLRNLKNAVVLRILYFTKFAFFAPNINQIKRNALCTSCFANTIVQTTQSSILTISNCPKYGFGIRKTPAYRWKYPWQETVVIWKTIIHYLNPLWKLRDKLQYNLVTIQERFQSSHLSSLCDFSSFLCSKGGRKIPSQPNTNTSTSRHSAA